jgi:hypothetical protein
LEDSSWSETSSKRSRATVVAAVFFGRRWRTVSAPCSAEKAVKL